MRVLGPPSLRCDLGGLSGASRPRSPHPASAPRDRRLQAEGGLPRIRAFFSAPVVVFHLNILSYFAFLCLFAYVLMVDFQPRPSGCECLIYLWLFSLVCEELRQVGPCPAPAPPTDPPTPGLLPGLGHFLTVALGPAPSPTRLTGPLRAVQGHLERVACGPPATPALAPPPPDLPSPGSAFCLKPSLITPNGMPPPMASWTLGACETPAPL